MDILTDFVATLPGKSLLEAHDWGPVGMGRFYHAHSWCFVLRPDAEGERGITRIKGGIAWAVSLSLSAPVRETVASGDSKTMFWKYRRSPTWEEGEALEVPCVFPGAQFDAGVVESKTADLARRAHRDREALDQPRVRQGLLAQAGRMLDWASGGATVAPGPRRPCRFFCRRRARRNVRGGHSS